MNKLGWLALALAAAGFGVSLASDKVKEKQLDSTIDQKINDKLSSYCDEEETESE